MLRTSVFRIHGTYESTPSLNIVMQEYVYARVISLSVHMGPYGSKAHCDLHDYREPHAVSRVHLLYCIPTTGVVSNR